ncbi:hypothetical protein GCM10017783_05350 [Deinococcus piscis]|uniref:Methyltransferase type 11 domain-containing protein n=1 Tax=Deinococcus piscis TaxID=394230 RepID=A0ABQ3K1H2_9DEIO|nr:class I SAM-dependent methyltransferase [Deinococcus piscis]GHF96405.1 hypothetical protein GCM10017783_05350 [Deinococcus piscis]
MLTLAQCSNFLLPVAWGYHTWRRASLTLLSGQPFSLGRETQLFLGHARPQPGDAWLDIGTSTGFYAGVLAAQGCRVTATDLSPAMLRAARGRVPGGGVTWVQQDSESLPPQWAGQFAGVTIGATLNETARPEALLHSASAALRPGGGLWLMYLRETGGPVQRALTRPILSGLNFPQPSWVAAHLPGCPLVMAAQFGAVRFEWRVRET